MILEVEIHRQYRCIYYVKCLRSSSGVGKPIAPFHSAKNGYRILEKRIQVFVIPNLERKKSKLL